MSLFPVFSQYTTPLLSSIRCIPVAIVTRLLVGKPRVHVSIPSQSQSVCLLWSVLNASVATWLVPENLSLGVKRPVKHSSPSSSNFNYEWSYISTLTSAFMACTGINYTLPLALQIHVTSVHDSTARQSHCKHVHHQVAICKTIALHTHISSSCHTQDNRTAHTYIIKLPYAQSIASISNS